MNKFIIITDNEGCKILLFVNLITLEYINVMSGDCYSDGNNDRIDGYLKAFRFFYERLDNNYEKEVQCIEIDLSDTYNHISDIEFDVFKLDGETVLTLVLDDDEEWRHMYNIG